MSKLQEQAAKLKEALPDEFDYEIIVGDDGSTDESTKIANRAINALPNCRYVEYKTNVGRAYIRNVMIDAAHFDHIVMMDADAAICTPDFVARYWKERHTADVVCGTLRNIEATCPRGCELRYRYEKNAEQWRATHKQGALPYINLSTFNLMICRSRIGGLRFDARCNEYGYEDSLFGLTLRAQGKTIKHIDNPLIHTGIDTNDTFLKKTETAMRTLHKLEGLMQEYAGTSRLYNSLRLFRLDGCFRLCFKIVRPLIISNLHSRHPIINLFQLYKLGYYALYDHSVRVLDKQQ